MVLRRAVAACLCAAVVAEQLPIQVPIPPQERMQHTRVSERVRKLVQSLTLPQKIGQMTQLNIDLIQSDTDPYAINATKVAYYINNFFVGSFLNVPAQGSPNVTQWSNMIATIQSVASSQGSKIPIIYGLDSVHGANYVYGAAIFPQPLAVSASFNRTAAYIMAATGAKDTRAAGIPWGFAPILGVMSQPIWPRCYETLGNDPFLASEMATQLICGAQGCPRVLSDPTKVAASAKHFIGYPNPRSGHDRTPAWIPWRHLLNYYAPSFQAAIDAGVATTMESYSEVDGVPMASSAQYLQLLLRDMMGFDGFLVTDWAEIENLYMWHNVASSPDNAVLLSMNRTSIDMSMVPEDTSFFTSLLNLVNSGAIPESRVDESVARILAIKEELGLLDEWVGGKRVRGSDDVQASVGSAADRAAALDIARQSVVLLQNTNQVLPFRPSQARHGASLNILLVGPSADSISYQAGGWSIHWQGAPDSAFAYGTTVLDALLSASPGFSFSVKYEPGCDILGNINSSSAARALQLLNTWADVAVFVGGEPPYAEKPGNIDDLSFAAGQVTLIQQLSNTSVPLVLVLFEGRPRLLGAAATAPAAVLHGLLTGPDAGIAIAEMLLGQTVPSGRLPFDYPSASGNALVHYWHSHPETDSYTPQWGFGTGLSYSTFTYSNLVLNATSISVAQLLTTPISATITVTNSGPMAASTSVLLYLTDVYRTVTPEVKMLKGFERVQLGVGQSTTVSFVLPAKAFQFWNEDMMPTQVIETGTFVISIQDSVELAALTVTP